MSDNNLTVMKFFDWVNSKSWSAHIRVFTQVRKDKEKYKVTEISLLMIADPRTNEPHKSFRVMSDDGIMDCLNQLWEEIK